jgi:hypothetical protein
MAERNLLVTYRLSGSTSPPLDLAEFTESFGGWMEIEDNPFVLWTVLPKQEVHDLIRCPPGKYHSRMAHQVNIPPSSGLSGHVKKY